MQQHGDCVAIVHNFLLGVVQLGDFELEVAADCLKRGSLAALLIAHERIAAADPRSRSCACRCGIVNKHPLGMLKLLSDNEVHCLE